MYDSIGSAEELSLQWVFDRLNEEVKIAKVSILVVRKEGVFVNRRIVEYSSEVPAPGSRIRLAGGLD